MHNLRKLNASKNHIATMSDFDILKTMPSLVDLRLFGNELMSMIPDARRLVIYNIPDLHMLDGSPIETMEKVS